MYQVFEIWENNPFIASNYNIGIKLGNFYGESGYTVPQEIEGNCSDSSCKDDCGEYSTNGYEYVELENNFGKLMQKPN